jgi:arsenate reductase
MKTRRAKVVFICVENAGRSQMAEAFAEALGRGLVEAYSAGSKPAIQVNPLVVEAMKEKGIDLSGKKTKGLNDLPPVEMDYLVTMGCEETCPAIPSRKIIEWQIPDPKGKPLDEVRRIRDLLEAKVKMLLEEV